MSARDTQLADGIWRLMLQQYGSKWVAKYNTPELVELGRLGFAKALRNKSVDALKRGKYLLEQAAPEFPPGPSAFAQMCTIPAEQRPAGHRQLENKAHPSVTKAWVETLRKSALHGEQSKPFCEELKARDQDRYRQLLEDHKTLMAEHERKGKIKSDPGTFV